MTVRVFFDPHRVDQLRQKGINPQRQLPGPVPEARTALELVEENARLRAENRRLLDEVSRLTSESSNRGARQEPGLVAAASRRPDPPRREERAPDDAAQRFSLLELDL